jgi:hypothetical protein
MSIPSAAKAAFGAFRDGMAEAMPFQNIDGSSGPGLKAGKLVEVNGER